MKNFELESHPSSYIQPVFRGKVCQIVKLNKVTVFVDLGFQLTGMFTLELFNLSVPDILSDQPTEVHAAAAMLDRLIELAMNQQVLLVTYPNKVSPTEWYGSLFLHDRARDKWYSLEDRLVREKHCAWENPNIEIPSIEGV